ncbi:AMIN domain-containing protein [Thermodesulfobacteriota bacterium]
MILTILSVLIVPNKLGIAYANERQKEPNAVIDRTDPPLIIKDITFKLGKDGKEIIAIHANRRFTPTVFALEEFPPRLVIDIKNINTLKRDLCLIQVDGKFIKQIRSHLHKDSKTLRVVLDNSPYYKYYKVDQIFYEGDNIYVFEVTGKGELCPTEKKGVEETEKMTE